MAAEVDVGTISALEVRDSSRSQFFPQIAKAFGLTLEQLADEGQDYEIDVGGLKKAGPILNPEAGNGAFLLVAADKVTQHITREPSPVYNLQPPHDELTLAAIKIMQELDKQQKFAMLAKMREFKQHLDPPRIDQAL